jgi:hypothetical protein
MARSARREKPDHTCCVATTGSVKRTRPSNSRLRKIASFDALDPFRPGHEIGALRVPGACDQPLHKSKMKRRPRVQALLATFRRRKVANS